MTKNVLITGGCGFIAHHLVNYLLEKTDWNITIIDRLDYSSFGLSRLRDTGVLENSRIRFFAWPLEKDFSSNIKKELGYFNYIIHTAAGSHVDNSIESPRIFMADNINNTITMLDFAKENMPELFIYFSTDEVYGSAAEDVIFKEGDRFNPGNPYAASKAASECICMSYANTFSIPIIITNTMNVIGTRQHPEKFMPLVINKILNDEMIDIHKGGQRHYMHVDNVSDGILFLLNNNVKTLDKFDSTVGKYNIVGSKEYDNLVFAKKIGELMNKKIKYQEIDFSVKRPGYDTRYSLSGEKMKSLGWQPLIHTDECLKDLVEWYTNKNNKKWLVV